MAPGGKAFGVNGANTCRRSCDDGDFLGIGIRHGISLKLSTQLLSTQAYGSALVLFNGADLNHFRWMGKKFDSSASVEDQGGAMCSPNLPARRCAAPGRNLLRK